MTMKLFSCDIETSGSDPVNFSILSIGCVAFEGNKVLGEFYVEMAPDTCKYEEEALTVNGIDFYEALTWKAPAQAMREFAEWIDSLHSENERITFMSDNAGFDWLFVATYFARYVGYNPFGWSPMSLTWLFKGMKGVQASLPQYRKKHSSTTHDHNSLNDARSNHQAYVHLMGLNDG